MNANNWTMSSLFLELYPSDLLTYFLRFLFFLGIPFLLTWLLHIGLSKFEDKNIPIVFRRRLALNKSIIVVLLIVNSFLFYIIRINGFNSFDWMSFPMNLRNVYLALSPILMVYIGLSVWYIDNSNKLLAKI